MLLNLAKFLYYLFDRHWTLPDEKWRYIVDDFAATFSITRHSLLESLTFYLLDDHTDKALQVTFVLWVLIFYQRLDVHLTDHSSNAE